MNPWPAGRALTLIALTLGVPSCRDGESDAAPAPPVFSALFLASDVRADSAPAGASTVPRVACSGALAFAAWTDDRGGNGDIYFAFSLNSGESWADDSRVDQDAGLADADSPAVAAAATRFWVVWRDTRNGDSDIYARIYDSSGIPSGNDFRVDTDPGSSDAAAPAIAATTSSVTVVWQDDRDGSDDIRARIFSTTGVPSGNDFRVDQDPGLNSAVAPAVAARGTLVFFAWQDDRNGDEDIYARIYDDGAPAGSDFRADDDPVANDATAPSIAVGNAVAIAWQDVRNGNPDVYARLFGQDGTPSGGAFRADQGATTTAADRPAVASEGTSVWIAWRDDRNADADIYLRWYVDGLPRSNDFRVDKDPGTTAAAGPALCADNATVIVVWSDPRDGDADIWSNVSKP